jgi:hypothetical protein
LVRGITHSLITTVIAPILALSRIVIIVIPPIGFELSEGKALIVVDVIGRLVGAPSDHRQARKQTSQAQKGFFDTA